VLRAVRKATDSINKDRDGAIKIVAREMKLDEGLAREIMTYNVYSMEMNDKIVKGMGEFVDFLHSLDRIKQKFPPDQVFYTKILEEVDPSLVKWKAKTDVK
jgi:sulfonate transport system substrate-binding protein